MKRSGPKLGKSWDALTDADIEALRVHQLDSRCKNCEYRGAAMMICPYCGSYKMKYATHSDQRKESVEAWCGQSL